MGNLNQFQKACRTSLRAFLASIAEIQLDVVMLAFGKPDEAVIGAIHPTGFAIHAHAARHAAWLLQLRVPD
jgi:hypothetical protein